MNKINILLALLLCLGTVAYAQEQNTNPQETETLRKRNEGDQRVYQLAMRYNDLPVARMKLLELIERNPNNNRYPELLATLYFDAGQFTSAAVAALDLLEKNDQSATALEIAAYSLEQLGAMDRALPHFERHYLITGNLFSLYKSAYMQFSLNKEEEALNSVNMIIRDRKSTDELIGFPTNNNDTQEVSLKAAALNLKGMIYMGQKNKEEAIEAFNESLSLSPDFLLAQENLKEARSM
ncbi:tetratricopeptide repeat protein [Cecembia lonarensis]|uniref:Putative PEP-CTERM system TPR-repeat lipoprotein n=1 Tax=Cecembia lonarensis (strain CCUG 58316 / KCTC 22772 / LW9) TaxID=1225176 RepID=K1L0W9_CECL9|nr:tetratricopeptide repeat protein [Cecembia lonarensis]EKB48421.1 putative PEP-CTERM system TPR-repeat lipoprotein [Cecembia lonarensis LW9]